MAKEFEIKDSGQRQSFDTGAVRDTQEGKPRYDLIPHTALRRIAMHYAKGAKKYNEWNWAMGMEFSRFYASMFRHLQQFAAGDTDEDHLAAICFNALSIMHFQDIEADELDDMQSRIPEPEMRSDYAEEELTYRPDQETVQDLGGF
jgi:hypothetical protein